MYVHLLLKKHHPPPPNYPPPFTTTTTTTMSKQLDKEPWEEVRREMTEEKGLEGRVADRIGTFVTYKGPPQALHAKVCVVWCCSMDAIKGSGDPSIQ